ncbi:DUF916 domain-containing protein [Candidatus Saccharibacteria bacterium]|nr:DUF916 domain-containing protein [Candidatus Saccharibacteria bacterium]
MENNTFTVTPMNQTISLTPGEKYEGSITVINPSDSTEDFNYKVTTAPYGVSGSDYEADLVTETSRTQLKEWITIDEPTGTIAPNSKKKITFTISVPEDASGGGQYAAILVGSNNEDETSNGVAIQNVFEMASLVYATVSGDAVHDGEIVNNEVPGFVAVPPVTLSAMIKNSGNVHERATFVIKVTNFFTGEVILPTDENEGVYTEVIMPETERTITRDVGNLPVLGVVRVNQTIYYNGVMSEEEKEVIICPIWFILLVLITLVAIITTIVRIILKHKRRKQVA